MSLGANKSPKLSTLLQHVCPAQDLQTRADQYKPQTAEHTHTHIHTRTRVVKLHMS